MVVDRLKREEVIMARYRGPKIKLSRREGPIFNLKADIDLMNLRLGQKTLLASMD